MKRWVIVVAAVGAIALAGLSYAALSGGVPVEAARVEQGDVHEYVDEEGKTRLSETHLITMPFTARLEAIDLVEGTPVEQGQVVAQVVPLDLELNVAAAAAAVDRLKASIKENDDVSVESTGLKQALSYVEAMDRSVEAANSRVKAGEAKLNFAEKNLARVRRLRETNARTEEDLDQAQLAHIQSSVDYRQDVLVERAMEALQAATALLPTAVRQYIERKSLTHEVLEKQLAEAQVNLQQMEKEQKRGVMTSPVDGVVLERLVTNERPVTAGTVLLQIGRWEDLEVEADVLSQEVVRIKPGNVVEISGPAIGNTAAKGTVSRVYPAGFTKVSSLGVEQQRVKVIIKFLPEDLQRLRAERDLGVEFRVRVRIFTAQKSGALAVPRSALFRGAAGNWQVFVVRDGRATIQQIKLGLNNDERAEVTEGLSRGDIVVLAPETNLTNGSRVEPIVHGS